MAPVGFALLGSGIFILEKHLPSVLQDPSLLSLKAIYSRTKASAKGTIKNVEGVDIYSEDSGDGRGLDDLLARKDVEAVIIALPIPVQHEYIKKALAAGKHVLAEKPVAKDLATAHDLLAWKAANAPSLNLSIAENWRFMTDFTNARSHVESFGKILYFSVRVTQFVRPGGKYFETAWRKTPTFQGGYCLDGGVHMIAGMRILVGENNLESLVATTALLQKHIPPIDTIHSVLKLKDGTPGTFSLSFGQPSVDLFEFTVACEGGSVTIERNGKLTVRKVGEDPVVNEASVVDGTDGLSSVKPEVKSFAEAIRDSKPNARQSPELAVGDLEVIEKMLKSGEQGGKELKLEFQ